MIKHSKNSTFQENMKKYLEFREKISNPKLSRRKAYNAFYHPFKIQGNRSNYKRINNPSSDPKKNNSDSLFGEVTVAMCTQPHRKESMLRVVKTILPQCDRMCICFNNYDKIPDELPKSDKLICVLAGEGKEYKDLGCLNKMLWLGDFPGYYATVDDDLIYSDNYIEELRKKVDYYNGECICTYHGKKFEINNGCIVKDKYKLYYYYSIYDKDIICTIGGMGVAMMVPSKLGITKDLYLKYPKNYGDDEITAIYAADHYIKIYRVSNKDIYVKPSEEAYTGMWSDKNSRDTRLKMMLDYKNWNDYEDHSKDVFFRIIIPTYNTSNYIKRCLESISRQTFKNFKVVVIDDNSDDKHITEKICKEYKFVEYVQSNSHVDAGGCRNIGLKYILDSKYTLYCDSDDYYMDNNAFQKLYDHIIKNNYPDCVNFSFYYESKKKTYKPCYMEVPWCHCINTKLCKQFRAYRRKHNDVIWYLRQFDVLENVSKLDECLYYYTNQNPNSLQLDNVNKCKYDNRVLSSYFYLMADLLEEKFTKQNIKKEASTFFKIIYDRIKKEYSLESIMSVIKK